MAESLERRDGEPQHRASCHCGRVRIDVFAALPDEIYDCNCSICTKKAYLHWFVPKELARIEVDDDALATYTFNTGRAKHHFCAVCGAAPFYVARSHPDNLDVNVRCVEGVDLSQLTILPFDGRNWETAVKELHAKAPPSSAVQRRLHAARPSGE